MRSLSKSLYLVVTATLGLSASAGYATAADMPVEYPPIIEAPAPLPLASVGGWYLRGDIGYKFYNAPDTSSSDANWGSTAGVGNFANEKLFGAGDIGIGAGYKFNDYLRTDLTLDYETPAKFKGSLWCNTGAAPCATGAFHDTERAKITAWSALANLYADLGTYQGLTPYLGAGAGLSYLQTSAISSSDKDASSGKYPDGDGKWNFAWALMAGVSYPITEQLSFDLGYRYLNLGDARTGSVTDSGGRVTHMNYKNISAHEVRLGLRYALY